MTKWLQRLEASGTIASTREHVPGRPLRKTVYHLTDSGWKDALRLRAQLEADIVEVRAAEEQTLPIRVAQIPEVFPSVNLVNAVASIQRGFIDLSRTRAESSDQQRTTVWGTLLRRPDCFVGRNQELATLEKWVLSPSRVLAVVGLPGTGKSTLVSAWLHRRQTATPVFWASLSPSTTESRLLADLARFLSRFGHRNLTIPVGDGGPADLGLVSRVLADALNDSPCILIVDNLQQALPEVETLLSEAILPLARARRTRIVLISRSIPAFLRPHLRRHDIGGEILRVGGLDPVASRALLAAKGFRGDSALAAQLIAGTRGHPLLLAVLAARPSVSHRGIRQYLDHEVFRDLTPREISVLEFASVFRRAAPVPALLGFDKETDGVLRSLEARTLLETTVSGGYFVHDMLREYLLKRMRRGRRERFHLKAAAHFLGLPTPRDRVEAIYHLAAVNRWAQAADFLAKEGPALLDSVSASEVVQTLHGFPTKGLDGKTASVLWETLGDSLRILGHLAPAKLEYRHALQQAQNAGLQDGVPRLLRKLAFLDRCRGNLSVALGRLVEARALLFSGANPSETAEVLREMALVEEAGGHLDAATGYENEAVDRATESSDPGVLARCLSVLGTLLTQKGAVEEGLQHKLESLRIAERAGNLAEMSRSNITVGTSYHELRRFDDALLYYRKGLELARLLGNLRLTAVAALDCGVALLDLHRYSEAGEPIEEARHLFEVLEEPTMLAVLDINEGQRQAGLGRWSLATRKWEKGLRALRGDGDSYELLRSLDDVAGQYRAHGDAQVARDLWAEARVLARGLGNPSKIAAIENALAEAGFPPSPRLRPPGDRGS